jgi:hypothetical protein
MDKPLGEKLGVYPIFIRTEELKNEDVYPTMLR